MQLSDLKPCLVLSNTNVLRERLVYVALNIVHLTKMDKNQQTLDVVMAEELRKAHAINQEPIQRQNVAAKHASNSG